MTPGGFSHSETHGSKPANGSPWLSLFGCVLHRLSAPKHPPSTLDSLAVLFLPERNGRETYETSIPRTRRTESPPVRVVLALPLFGFQGSWRGARGLIARTPMARGPGAPVLAIPRKEVIQPQVLLRLPCYDLVPVTGFTFGASLPCGLGQRLRALPASMA